MLMTIANLVALITNSVLFGTVIMLGCCGEILTEKSGNLNLGVPGVMYLGGIASLAGCYAYESGCAAKGTTPAGYLCVIIALVCGFAAAALGGLLYSFITVTLRANQNVTGLALTIFGAGTANFFGGLIMQKSGGVGTINLSATAQAFRAQIPFLPKNWGVVSEVLFSYGAMVYAAVILAVAMSLFLSKTRAGLNLRAVGESPATADAAGIRVGRCKYLSTCVGAGICGLGGVFYIMYYIKGMWANDGYIEALGWLAVALVIFTGWRPVNAIWGSYLFGVCYWVYTCMPEAVSRFLASTLGLTQITYTQNLYKMLPYIATILVLIIGSIRQKKENQAPQSLGLSYFREER